MKSMLFGLAMLCALPGCCGMWKCNKDECEDNGNVRRSKKEMRDDKQMKKDMKDSRNYKK